jgi:uncharacterized protein (DUF362 family)
MSIKAYLEKRDCYSYPSSKNYFSPHIFYPEYPFSKDTISSEPNEIYDMVRSSLHGLGLDTKNFATKQWNPLGDYVKANAKILIKPNWVNHENPVGGLDCTVTHPAIIRCIIDYCIIAGAEIIEIGDAPIQGCDFRKLLDVHEYNCMFSFILSKGFSISVKDFRMTIAKRSIKGTILQTNNTAFDDANAIEFDLNEYSRFFELPDNLFRYEITQYHDNKLNSHHNNTHHQYLIARSAIESDLVINLPKPKTHRLAGITGAQKNFIGICSDKEYLPHFRIGTSDNGGDESNHSTLLDSFISILEQQYCKYIEQKNIAIQIFYKILQKSIRALKKIIYHKTVEYFSNGQWYGNDTIWRTILDINLILLYGNANGIININSKPKSVLTIGDMIIAGEREGPLNPSPKPLGIILSSDNCAVFDFIFCKITGFDFNFIPSINNALSNQLLLQEPLQDIYMSSNLNQFNDISLDRIVFPSEWNFLPNPSWDEVFSNMGRKDQVWK